MTLDGNGRNGNSQEEPLAKAAAGSMQPVFVS